MAISHDFATRAVFGHRCPPAFFAVVLRLNDVLVVGVKSKKQNVILPPFQVPAFRPLDQSSDYFCHLLDVLDLV